MCSYMTFMIEKHLKIDDFETHERFPVWKNILWESARHFQYFTEYEIMIFCKGAIHLGRPAKIGIFRPPSPVSPGLTIEFL